MGRVHEGDPRSGGLVTRSSSFEAELSEMLAAVLELDHEHSARSFPGLVRLPDIAVLVGGRVVTQTAAARRDSLFNILAGFCVTALNRTGSDLISAFPLRSLCELCASAVKSFPKTFTTETPRTLRSRREFSN